MLCKAAIFQFRVDLANQRYFDYMPCNFAVDALNMKFALTRQRH